MSASTHVDTMSFRPILVFKCGSKSRDRESYDGRLVSRWIALWFAEKLINWATQMSFRFMLDVSLFSAMFHGFCVIVSISIRNFTYFCLNRIVSLRCRSQFENMNRVVQHQSCRIGTHTPLKEFRKWIPLIVHTTHATQHYCICAPLSRMMQ